MHALAVESAQAETQVPDGIIVDARREAQAVGHLELVGRARAVLDEVVPVVHECVQAGDDERLVAPVAGAAPQADAGVVPGGGEDGEFSLRAVYGEEIERLVRVVQAAHRHHDMADSDVELRREALLDPELLQLHLAAFLDLRLPFPGFSIFLLHGGAGSGVLEFDLGLQGPALAEVVAEINYGMRNVETAVRRIVLIISGMGIAIDVVAVEIAGQGYFTVAPDGQAAAPLRSHLRGQRRSREQGSQYNQYTAFHFQTNRKGAAKLPPPGRPVNPIIW